METNNQSSKGFLHPKVLWSVAAFLLAVVIVGSVFWWQEEKKAAENLKQANLTSPVEKADNHKEGEEPETVLPDGTKVYHNDTHEFEIKIPSDWTASSLGSSNEIFFNSKNGLEMYFTNAPIVATLGATIQTETINGKTWSIAYSETSGWYYETTSEGKTYVFQPGGKAGPNNKLDASILSSFKFYEHK